jgi:uncharacterized protein (DUF433 family)
VGSRKSWVRLGDPSDFCRLEAFPGKDIVVPGGGSALVIQVKSVRQELDADLKKLERAAEMAVSDPEVMHGTPVYRGTRIPVGLVANMVRQGTKIDEILEGYPALDREKVELAPFYVQAFPRRGRPTRRPWAKRRPVRVTRELRSLADRQ